MKNLKEQLEEIANNDPRSYWHKYADVISRYYQDTFLLEGLRILPTVVEREQKSIILLEGILDHEEEPIFKVELWTSIYKPCIEQAMAFAEQIPIMIATQLGVPCHKTLFIGK